MTLVGIQNAKKTALIKTLINEDAPIKGWVYLDGVNMAGVVGQYPNGLIGYAPYKLNLLEFLTVE